VVLDFLRLVVASKARRLTDELIEKASFAETGMGDFMPYYRASILPYVKEFEKQRLLALRSLRSRVLITIPVIAGTLSLGWYLLLLDHFKNPDAVFFFGFLIIAGICAWAGLPVKNYRKSLKTKIYPRIFGFYGGDFAYYADSPIRISEFTPYDIVPSYDTEYPGDYVRGTYKGVLLELLEAKMTETRGSGKNRRTVTVFEGMFVRMGVYKKFEGKTIIKRDYGMMNWAVNGFQKLERIKLEDPRFEKQFEVFGTSQVEARYLLTTSFMDRLVSLTTSSINYKGLQASFFLNRLLMMVQSGKDYFGASSIFKPVTFIDEINNVLSDMKIFFDIIDTLKLDDKTRL